MERCYKCQKIIKPTEQYENAGINYFHVRCPGKNKNQPKSKNEKKMVLSVVEEAKKKSKKQPKPENIKKNSDNNNNNQNKNKTNNSSNGNYVQYKTQKQMEEEMKQNDSESQVSLQCKKIGKWIIGSPIKLLILVNIQKKFMDKDNLFLVLYFPEKNSYFRQTQITCDQTANEMTIDVTPLAVLSNLPSKIQIALLSDQKKLISTDFLLYPHYFLDNILINPKETPIMREILLFGFSESGKSSLINAFFTAVNDSIQPLTKVIGQKQKTLQAFSIPNIRIGKVCNFRLYESPGLESKSYLYSEFESIVVGKIPQGWKMDNTPLKNIHVSAYDMAKMNCVIFCFPCELLDKLDPPTKLVERMKDFLAFCLNRECEVLIALTKADLLNYDFEGWNSQLEKEKARVAECFGIPRGRIFPIVTYVNRPQKQFKVDRDIINLLLTANQLGNDISQMRNRLLDLFSQQKLVSNLTKELEELKENLLLKKENLQQQQENLQRQGKKGKEEEDNDK